MGDEAAAALHFANDQIRRLATIEARPSVLQHPLKARGQVRLAENLPGFIGYAVGLGEDRSAGRMARKGDLPRGQGAGRVARQGKALSRQAHRRLDHLAPLQGAVLLQRAEQAVHRTGHTDRQVRCRGQPIDHIALLILKHLPEGSGRRLLAMVVGGQGAVGHANQHEAAAAEVARRGMGHRQGEAGGHRRIHRVATPAQHGGADFGGDGGTGGDHPLGAEHRLGAGTLRPSGRQQNQQGTCRFERQTPQNGQPTATAHRVHLHFSQGVPADGG